MENRPVLIEGKLKPILTIGDDPFKPGEKPQIWNIQVLWLINWLKKKRKRTI